MVGLRPSGAPLKHVGARDASPPWIENPIDRGQIIYLAMDRMVGKAGRPEEDWSDGDDEWTAGRRSRAADVVARSRGFPPDAGSGATGAGAAPLASHPGHPPGAGVGAGGPGAGHHRRAALPRERPVAPPAAARRSNRLDALRR